jgi:hypothetical protein
MEKFMKSVLNVVLVALMFVGANAQASDLGGPGLRDDLTKEFQAVVLKKVLEDSKSSKSEIGKLIAKNDIEDGRNSRGTINLPLSPKDIKITLISGEDQFGFYYDSETKTMSNGKSAVFLVTIASVMGVHKAIDYDSVAFVVNVSLTNTYPEDNAGEDLAVKQTITAEFVKELKWDVWQK